MSCLDLYFLSWCWGWSLRPSTCEASAPPCLAVCAIHFECELVFRESGRLCPGQLYIMKASLKSRLDLLLLGSWKQMASVEKGVSGRSECTRAGTRLSAESQRQAGNLCLEWEHYQLSCWPA